MNTKEPEGAQPVRLFSMIKSILASVGNVLNDSELTCFLQKVELPSEAGFAFLSISFGHVTLAVPRQNLKDWYATKGWITPQKEMIAKGIAKKYDLQLYEPFDDSLVLYPELASSGPHHHLALSDRRQTVIVAHPLFLKICLFGKPQEHSYGSERRFPLPLGPNLLQDISPLYQYDPTPRVENDTSVKSVFQK